MAVTRYSIDFSVNSLSSFIKFSKDYYGVPRQIPGIFHKKYSIVQKTKIMANSVLLLPVHDTER